MARQLKYNGTALETFNVFWDGSKRFTTPRKNAKFYSVPARNGDIASWDGSFSNVELQVDCFIRENFEQNFSALVKYLYMQEGYNQLIFDTDDGYYRMAQFVNAIVPNTGAYNEYAHFTLVFNCTPQKFAIDNTDYHVENDEVYVIAYERNSQKVSSVLNLLDASQVPDDTLFYLVQLPVGPMNYTQVNLSWNQGPCFFCVFEAESLDYNAPTRIITTSLNSLTNASFTVTGQVGYAFVLVGYRDSGSITITGRAGSTNFDYSKNNLGRNMAVMGGADYVGVNFGDMTARIWNTGNYARSSYAVFRRYQGDELVAEGIMVLTLDASADLTGYTTTYEDYDYGEVTYYDLRINPDTMTCHLIKEGLPDKNFGRYINIYGGFSGIGDKATVHVFTSGGLGWFRYIDITPNWWKL